MKKQLSYIDSVHRSGTIWNISVMILLLVTVNFQILKLIQIRRLTFIAALMMPAIQNGAVSFAI